jgi:DNA processing protein
MVAVVGSRQCSAARAKLARHFAVQLGRAGYVIASALARGIDGVAHAVALEHGIVAVLAGGIDVLYPPEHQELQSAIGERGGLLTEMPVGFRARGKDFPCRNHIISDVSLGVLIVEAARRSGPLGTARLAAEQSREVFAVPGGADRAHRTCARSWTRLIFRRSRAKPMCSR